MQTDIYKYTLIHGDKSLANGAFTPHEGIHFALHRMPLLVISKKGKIILAILQIHTNTYAIRMHRYQ